MQATKGSRRIILLVDKDSKPEDTVLYVASCALEILKHNQYNDIEDLRQEIQTKYNIEAPYKTLVTSLNFLFLVDKVTVKDKTITCI